MDLVTIINKHDYFHGNVNTEGDLESQLSEIDEDEYCKTLNWEKLDTIVKAFIQKVCVKGYPVKTSKPYWMAYTTLIHIQDVMENCVDNNIVQKIDVQDILFDLYVELLKTGPGTSHCELIMKLVESLDMDEYIERIYGEKLIQVIDAFKLLNCIKERLADKDSEEVTIEEHGRTVARCIVKEVKRAIGTDVDESKAKMPENHVLFLDLYYFYLTQMTKLPVVYLDLLSDCQRCIERAYDNNMYKGFHDAEEVRKHLGLLEAFICNDKLPEHVQMQKCAVESVEEVVKIVESPFVLEVWDDLMKFLKGVCLHKNIAIIPGVAKSLKDLITELDEKHLRVNSNLFESWAPVMSKILNGAKQFKSMTEMIEGHVLQMKEKVKPAKSGHDKLWLPVLLGLMKWPWKKTYQAAKHLLKESKWKRSWNWKENLRSAKQLLILVRQADLPKDENGGWDDRDVVSYCADIIGELMDQLEIVKMNGKVQEELVELFLSIISLESEMLNNISQEVAEKIVFGDNQNIIPKALAKFVNFLRDDYYPWQGGYSKSAAMDFVIKCLEGYRDGSRIPDDVNEILVDMFKYITETDKDMIEIEDGNLTVYAMMISGPLVLLVAKHRQSNSLETMEPLIPYILKLLDKEDHENLHMSLMACFSLLHQKAGKILAPSMALLLDQYLKSQEQEFLQCILDAYEYNPDPVSAKFDQLLDIFTNDQDLYAVHAMFLKKAAELQPEMFTEDAIKKLMDHHFMDSRANLQMLMVFEVVAEKNPEVLAPYLKDRFYNNSTLKPQMGMMVVRIIISVAVKMEEHRTSALNYFMKTLKNSSNEIQMQAMLYGLRELASAYGKEMFTGHKKYLEDLRTTGQYPDVRDSASNLCDLLEGRSLQKVSDDVEEQQNDIEKLGISVAGTKVVVKKVQKTVQKQEDDIQDLKTGMTDVNERVDNVEQDVEDVKEKVEEVDKKTMSNAPVWSRDLTKLMNPETEADWRMLASRLGYNRDDIKGWATQSDPCMALLSEWYATHKTVEATHAVLVTLQEINRLDGVIIVENAMKAVENVVPEDPVDYAEPPQVFLSYQWGHQNEVKLIRKHLEMAGYTCWMDIGQMGGGDKLFEKIDAGIRGAKIVVSCVTEKYAKSPNCNREVNLSVTLGKPIIPLLLEKMSWPPPGSMGPIFSEYIFIRFFQRHGEETHDERIWPAAKFVELLMQLNYLNIMPNESAITPEYKTWWKPIEQTTESSKQNISGNSNTASTSEGNKPKDDGTSPEVFISYQWGKQKEISALYQRLSALGLHCWMDIHQMGGGDSLYDKIDRGIRGSKVVLSSVTPKYALSMNCRREVSLADALKKPIIPMLMDKMVWPPDGPMSMPLTQLIYINFTKDDSIQQTWKGQQFDELITKIREYIPDPNSKTEGKKITERESNSTLKDTPDSANAVAVKERTKEVSAAPEIQKEAENKEVTKGKQDANTADTTKYKQVEKADSPNEESDSKINRNVENKDSSPKTNGKAKKSSTCILL